MPEPDYDYTQESSVRTFNGETPFSDPNDAIGDYEIAEDVVAPEKSAEEIEQESGFREVPPGTYRLKVLGFLIKKGHSSPIIEKWKDAWYGDRKEGFKAHSVTVKLADRWLDLDTSMSNAHQNVGTDGRVRLSDAVIWLGEAEVAHLPTLHPDDQMIDAKLQGERDGQGYLQLVEWPAQNVLRDNVEAAPYREIAHGRDSRRFHGNIHC